MRLAIGFLCALNLICAVLLTVPTWNDVTRYDLQWQTIFGVPTARLNPSVVWRKYDSITKSRHARIPSPMAYDSRSPWCWKPFLTKQETVDPVTIAGIQRWRQKVDNAIKNGHEWCNVQPNTPGAHDAHRGLDLGQQYLQVLPTRHLVNAPGKGQHPWDLRFEKRVEMARHLQEMIKASLSVVGQMLKRAGIRGTARIADTSRHNRRFYDHKYKHLSNLTPGLIFPLFHTDHVSRSLLHMHVYVVLNPHDRRFHNGHGGPAWDDKSWADIFGDTPRNPRVFTSISSSLEQTFRNIFDGRENSPHPQSFAQNQDWKLSFL